MALLHMSETSSIHSLPMRYADFPTLVEALNYAASGSTGMNFYDRHNQLTAVLEYRTLKQRALAMAQRLLALKLKKGDRVALLAETCPGFVEAFFACQYAGLVAVPLAIPMGVGQRDSYISRLQGLMTNCQPAAIVGSEEWLPIIRSASVNNPGMHILSHQALHALPAGTAGMPALSPDDIAYLQYTSGSTRFPRGVVITHRAVMANLQAISHDGIKLRAGDRCVSWLPFYHDMGLVGFLLTPLATQLSVDYLRTQDFAMRPMQWLKLISKTAAASLLLPLSVTISACAAVTILRWLKSISPAGAWRALAQKAFPPSSWRILRSTFARSISIATPLCPATVWRKTPLPSASHPRPQGR